MASECVYNQEEFCTNDQCPMCADYCPVPDMEGVCKYEEREEERWTLTPKGCFAAAIANHVCLSDDVIDLIWNDFAEIMSDFGYVKEE